MILETGRRDERDYSIVAIIPLYNGAKYIEEAIGSVFRQTLPPDEIIIVDDGSTDAGPEIVASSCRANDIRLLFKENGGQSSARNLGVANSKSALIAFLDQDDAWHPHHLEELIQPFRTEYGIPLGWTYSNLDEIDEQGRLVSRSFLSTLPSEHPKQHLFSCLRQDMFVLPSASLIARKAFEFVGGFDERLSGYEDDDLFLRLFVAGYENVYINKPLSRWRIYPESSSYSPRMGRSRLIYAKKLFQNFPNDPARCRYLSRDLIAPRFFGNVCADYCRALRLNDKQAMQCSLEGLELIIPYLNVRLRARLRHYLLLWLMRSHRLARAAYRARFITLPFARRLLWA